MLHIKKFAPGFLSGLLSDANFFSPSYKLQVHVKPVSSVPSPAASADFLKTVILAAARQEIACCMILETWAGPLECRVRLVLGTARLPVIHSDSSLTRETQIVSLLAAVVPIIRAYIHK